MRILLRIQVSLPFWLLVFDLIGLISMLRFMNIIMRLGGNISGLKAQYALLLNFGVQVEVTGLRAMLFLVINFDLRCLFQSAGT